MGITTCWRRAYETAAREDLPWEESEDKVSMIAGATGLIGSQLARTILARKEECHREMSVAAPVRDIACVSEAVRGPDNILLYRWDVSDE